MPPKFKRSVSNEDVAIAKKDETEALLEQRSGSEEEDFFLNGPSAKLPSSNVENDRIKHVRVQIAEVTDVMRNNVGKIMERGERMEDLRDASERLSAASVDFQAASTRMKRRAWAQHMKTRAIIGVLSVLVIICVLVPIIVHYS